MNYVLGVGTQMARAAGPVAEHTSRGDVLAGTATRWHDLDPNEFPLLRRVGTQFGTHDDRGQFIAGLDLLLAGIAHASQAASGESSVADS